MQYRMATQSGPSTVQLLDARWQTVSHRLDPPCKEMTWKNRWAHVRGFRPLTRCCVPERKLACRRSGGELAVHTRELPATPPHRAARGVPLLGALAAAAVVAALHLATQAFPFSQ